MKRVTDPTDGVFRRPVLKAGAMATGLLALSVSAAADECGDDEYEEDDGAADDDEETPGDEDDADDEEEVADDDPEEPEDELIAQLMEVHAATRPYWADVSRAREDGYDGEVSPYTPGMGFHFVNPELIAEDERSSVELTDPPILVYVPVDGYEVAPGDEHDPERDDELLLAAVEFAHVGTEGASMDIFADEDTTHPPLVSEEEGWEFVEDAGISALHVWVPHWNPAGVFNPTNPTVP